VVEDHLGESLTTGGLSEETSETERLVDGKVSLDGEERSTRTLLLGKDLTTLSVKNRVNTTNSVLGTLDLDQKDGLLDTGLGKEQSSVGSTSHGRDDLTTTTVDSIRMHGNIKNVDSDGTHVLTKDGTLLGSPLEGSNNGILDLSKVLNGLGLVNNQVRTVTIRTETPDLTGIGNLPTKLVSHETGTSLEIITGVDLAGLNGQRGLLVDGLSLDVDTVMLVGGLGEGNHRRLTLDGLTVSDNGRRDLKRNTSVVVLKILQANLEMQLTSTGNNVLTRLGHVSKNTRVRLGKTLKTLNELGQIVGVLDLDGNLDDGGDRELHDLKVVSSVGSGKSTRLEQELVNTNETDNVTSGNIINGLDETTHHQDSTLNGLDEKIILLTRDVVGALNSDLLARLDGTSEDTAKSVETTLIGSGNHLGDVKHQISSGVTVLDGNSVSIVRGTLVKSLSTVVLSSDGRRKVDNNHLHEGVSSGQELSHDNLKEGLTLKLLLLTLKVNLELLKKNVDLVLLKVHDSSEDSENRVQNEGVESTVKGLAIGILVLVGPLLGLRVKVRVTPETLRELGAVNTELLGVSGGELTDSESPTVETRGESNGTLLGVDLNITKGLVDVGGDDDVDGLNSSGEGLVKILLSDLQLEESTINLVDNNNGLDTLTKSLTKDSLSLDTDTLNGIDDNKGTIGNTKSSSNLRREINVTGRVNQVDKELVANGLLLDLLDIIVGHLTVKRDSGRLDGNTSLLLILSGIGETSLTSLGSGNNTSLLDKGVGQGRFTVIDVSNNGHVTDIGDLVHKGTHLVHSEVNHLE
jgi:hypothetical protein